MQAGSEGKGKLVDRERSSPHSPILGEGICFSRVIPRLRFCRNLLNLKDVGCHEVPFVQFCVVFFADGARKKKKLNPTSREAVTIWMQYFHFIPNTAACTEYRWGYFRTRQDQGQPHFSFFFLCSLKSSAQQISGPWVCR